MVSKIYEMREDIRSILIINTTQIINNQNIGLNIDL